MFKKRPIILPRSKHSVSRENIPRNVLDVLYHLKKSGFAAYIVGGGVRDLLVGLHPKDFDIATDARPEQVKKIFRNCRLIGRRFRLAHVFFGREIIEVATFRAKPIIAEEDEVDSCATQFTEHGMLLRDNVYGTIADDAMRRDFTINALYYNIQDFSIVDYTDGIKDLKKGIIRMIGDPQKRYHEDPVRMLRAVRIAAKLGFKIEKHTEKPLKTLAGLIQNVAPARLFEETLKWFKSGKSLEVFYLLRQHGLFAMLFPQTEACFDTSNDKQLDLFLSNAFQDTDTRFKADKPSNPAYLFAVLLWPAVQHRASFYRADGVKPTTAFLLAQKDVLKKQKEHITIPHRLTLTIEEIWILQYRMQERRKNKIHNISHHPKFRAAYDFMVLRAKSHEPELKECAAWWRNKYDRQI